MVFMRFEPPHGPDRFGGQPAATTRLPRSLPMEMVRRGDQLIVAIDLPGVDPKTVDITVERNVVEISVHRQSLHRQGDDVVFDERPRGGLRRQLVLAAEIDAGDVIATCERGVLVLVLPASQASTPQKVHIACARDHREPLRAGTARPVAANE
jgi:HSP20 family protein